MPDFIVNNLPSVVLLLVASLIGTVAWRRNNTKQLRDIQGQVNVTYQSLSVAQKEEIAGLKRDMARCKGVLAAVRVAMKQQLGVEIEIDGDVVTLIKDEAPKRTRIMQVKIKEEIKKEDE